jgi:hypothetical protein
MLRELVAVILDAVRCGDWRRHLAAWWRVVRGAVTADDTVSLGAKPQR